MEYEELMKGFAERTGLQDLTVSDGSAAVEIDGHKVAFIHDDAAATVTIYGEIGFPPPDANGSFGEVMLKANHLFNGTDGAVLCQNPDTFAFALFRPLRLIDMDVETFCGLSSPPHRLSAHRRQSVRSRTLPASRRTTGSRSSGREAFAPRATMAAAD